MHELSLIGAVVDRVLEVSATHEGRRVRRVTLRIGALQQVVPDSLAFGFEALSRGTAAEGAVLDWYEAPARIECLKCRTVFFPESVFWACPSCGEKGGRIVEGDELILESVELLDEE